MNAAIGFNPPARGGNDDDCGVWKLPDAVDAQNAPTRSLENAQHAFPTAPTRSILNMLILKKLLPRSPDRSVT